MGEKKREGRVGLLVKLHPEIYITTHYYFTNNGKIDLFYIFAIWRHHSGGIGDLFTIKLPQNIPSANESK